MTCKSLGDLYISSKWPHVCSKPCNDLRQQSWRWLFPGAAGGPDLPLHVVRRQRELLQAATNPPPNSQRTSGEAPVPGSPPPPPVVTTGIPAASAPAFAAPLLVPLLATPGPAAPVPEGEPTSGVSRLLRQCLARPGSHHILGWRLVASAYHVPYRVMAAAARAAQPPLPE